MIWLIVGGAAVLIWFFLGLARAAGRAERAAEQHRRERDL